MCSFERPDEVVVVLDFEDGGSNRSVSPSKGLAGLSEKLVQVPRLAPTACAASTTSDQPGLWSSFLM